MTEVLLLLTLAMPPPLSTEECEKAGCDPVLHGERYLAAQTTALSATNNRKAIAPSDSNWNAAVWTRADRHFLTVPLPVHVHELAGVGNFNGVVSPHAPEYTAPITEAVGTMGRYVPAAEGMIGWPAPQVQDDADDRTSRLDLGLGVISLSAATLITPIQQSNGTGWTGRHVDSSALGFDERRAFRAGNEPLLANAALWTRVKFNGDGEIAERLQPTIDGDDGFIGLSLKLGYLRFGDVHSSDEIRRQVDEVSHASEYTPQEEQGKRDNVLRSGAVILAALTVAEIEVTRAVIERGGRELNVIYKPFEDKPGVLGLVNGAVTGGMGLVALELNRRGKKTEARIFLWTMNVAKAVVFAHNLRQLRKS